MAGPDRSARGWLAELLAVTGVTAAAALAGLLFAPVFTVRTLILPIVAVGVCVAVVESLLARSRLSAAWRAPLATLAGLVVLVETTLWSATDGGLPTGATLRAFADGVVNGWSRTLDSTWPARPEPSLYLFVPALVLVAALLGLGAVRRRMSGFVALLPSVVVVVIAQAYQPVSGAAAIGTGLAYAGSAAVLFIATRDGFDAGGQAASANRSPAARTGGGARRAVRVGVPIVLTLVALVLGTVAFAGVDGAQAYLLTRHHTEPVVPAGEVNPLDELAAALSTPDRVAFTDRTDAAVQRWPVAVLDDFDGVNWTTTAHFQQMGAQLPADPAVTAPTEEHHATITVTAVPGSWLPTEDRVRRVDDPASLVDPVTGTVLSSGATSGLTYQLDWDAPVVASTALNDAQLAPQPGADEGLGRPPSVFTTLARQAAGQTVVSTFQTALTLQNWFRQKYSVATGKDQPSGHSYPQLNYFLTVSKRGTSEQFAAAYVVLARELGIPARLVVGYRQPAAVDRAGAHVVHDGDMFAWPEVPVVGLGWVPLDPTGTLAKGTAPARDSLATATATASHAVTSHGPGKVAVNPPQPPPPPSHTSWLWVVWLAVGLAASPVACAVGVIVVKRIRRRWRRSRTPADAVLGAWREAQDRLRDNGVPATSSMTVRDLANATRPVLGDGAEDGLRRLSMCVNLALWSEAQATPTLAEQAWAAADAVRRATTARPVLARLAAAVAPRSLRSVPAG